MADMDRIDGERRLTEVERELELENDAARDMRIREEREEARMERLEDEELYEEENLPSRHEVHGRQPKLLVPLIVIALCLLAFLWVYRRETTQVSAIAAAPVPAATRQVTPVREPVFVEVEDISAYALPENADPAEWERVLESYMLEEDHTVHGTVTVRTDGEQLDVRAGPSEMYRTVDKVRDGATYPVLLWANDEGEARGEDGRRWYLIAGESPKSLRGWVPADHLDTSGLRVARSYR